MVVVNVASIRPQVRTMLLVLLLLLLMLIRLVLLLLFLLLLLALALTSPQVPALPAAPVDQARLQGKQSARPWADVAVYKITADAEESTYRQSRRDRITPPAGSSMTSRKERKSHTLNDNLDAPREPDLPIKLSTAQKAEKLAIPHLWHQREQNKDVLAILKAEDSNYCKGKRDHGLFLLLEA